MNWPTGTGLWWLALAVLLAIVELVVPGAFLVFLAIAAAIVGVFALLFPDLGLVGETIAFVLWTLATVLIGRRWYVDYAVASADPLLNDRGARLIGEWVTVTEAITDGSGRVRVGDGEWLARGPDAAPGTRVRIAGVQGTLLTVEVPPALP